MGRLADLRPAYGCVRVAAPVAPERLSQQTVSGKHDHLRRSRVIVAIPPTLTARIQYDPVMPYARDQLVQRYPQGMLTKVAAVYSAPFWRASGLTGQVLDTGGPVSASFDDSPPDASLGVPFGFVGGDNARSYDAMSPSERQSAVLNQYETWMGSVRYGERAAAEVLSAL